MTSASCDAPLPFATLVDYWAADISTGEEARVEEHAFACEACARRLEAIGELGRGIAAVAGSRGGVSLPLTRSLVDRLIGAGLTLRRYRGGPGAVIPCTVSADDDLLVSTLEADLRGVERVDVVRCDATGKPIHRNEDVPMDRARNEVVYSIAADEARTWPATTVIVRLVAVKAGADRMLGEYTFQHTPFRGA